ncbi:hypothetical protein GUJ93_ZPchr0002g26691 [Zizania palustris]|uniref:Uncharacterized protein n=1 Tax=Zizania palustris TaxID=103762 RepID=A0A8J5SSJ5_ZIZPA|nr:hypothetical protein GUJ93_ZPchr0002g26691 [Zizania palustris]
MDDSGRQVTDGGGQRKGARAADSEAGGHLAGGGVGCLAGCGGARHFGGGARTGRGGGGRRQLLGQRRGRAYREVRCPCTRAGGEKISFLTSIGQH